MQAGHLTEPVCSAGILNRCSQLGHLTSFLGGVRSSLRVIRDSLRIFESFSVLGVFSDTALQTISPTRTTARPNTAPYTAAIASKGNSQPPPFSDWENTVSGTVVVEPSITHATSASTIGASGQGPMFSTPEDDPPSDTDEMVICASTIPSDVLTTFSMPGSVAELPELLSQYGRLTKLPVPGLSGSCTPIETEGEMEGGVTLVCHVMFAAELEDVQPFDSRVTEM